MHIACHADGVQDGHAGGRAVGNDGKTIHADKGAAAHGIGTHALAQGLEDAAHAQCAQHGHHAALDGGLHSVGEELGGAFHALEQDVAGETIGHGYVEPVFKEVMAFGVAYEFEGKQALLVQLTEQGVSLERGFAALAVLCAVAHHAHLRVRAVVHVAGHKGGHHGVAYHVAGLGIRVGAGVAHQHIAVCGGQGRYNAGTLHARQQAQFDGAGCHGGAGVAGGEHGICCAVLHQIHGDAHGRFLLLAHSHDAAFLHGDHLGGVHKLNLRVVGNAGGLAAGAYCGLITHHVNLFQRGNLS